MRAYFLTAFLSVLLPCVSHAQQDAREPQRSSSETISIRGIVTGPDGEPVAGAQLFVNASERSDSIELGHSNSDGSFRFQVPRETLTRTVTPQHSLLKRKASLLAVADGLGAAWELLASKNGGRFGEMESEYEVRMTLVEDLPVNGRVVDPAGKPVAGAIVTVDRIHELRGDRWHKMPPAIQSLDVDSMTRTEIDVIGWSSGPYPGAWNTLLSATTDDAGEFTLTGLGNNRAAVLHVSGPGTDGPSYFSVLVRNDAAEFARLVREKYPPKGRDRGVRMFGFNPTIVVERARTVAGTVRDGSTGKPVEGASVYVLGVSGRAKTNRDGHYRLVRSDNARQITVVAYGEDHLYLVATQTLMDVGDTGEATTDFELPRGVSVHGKVVEQGTDRPIASEHRLGCHDVEPGPLISGYASYYPLKGNRWMNELGDGLPNIPFESSRSNHVRRVSIDGNGEFRMAVPPGPGVILINARPPEPFQYRTSVSRVPYLTLRGDILGTPSHLPPKGLTFPGIDRPISADAFHAYQLIDPDDADGALKLRFEVQPASSLDVRFTDPGGDPIMGVNAVGLVPFNVRGQQRVITVNDSIAKVYGMNVNPPRRVVAIALDGKHGASHEFRPQGSDRNADRTANGEPIEIRMQPTASLAFRLVSESTGNPLVGYQPYFTYGQHSGAPFHLRAKSHEKVATNEAGEVVISGIVPGVPISLFFVPPTRKSSTSKFGIEQAPEIIVPSELKGVTLTSGEFRDLGDLKAGVVP